MTTSGEGFGSVTMWGFSPAIDLQEDVRGCLPTNEEGIEVMNILLIGSGDCRHILKTMAQRRRHKKRKIHIYVVENNLELLGRHLLLLTLALEPSDKVGLQEKVDLFSELYGNALIRQQSAQYLQEKANLFIEMITDLDYFDERMPTIDLSQLKYKERDYLEGIFKFWREPNPKYFNISSLWDNRLRQYLGVRYDARKGVFDWDLSMKLHELGAKVVTKNEYFRWRENGVAFETREGIYDRPNNSMACGILLKRRDGERVPCRGYWGDMITGPYVAFGLDAEDKSLFKTANGKPTKTVEDITLHNLTLLFHELSSGQQSIRNDVVAIVEPERRDSESEVTHERTSHREFYAPIPCEEVCVHFLPLNFVNELPRKSKFKNLFNAAFVSASMVHLLVPSLKDIFAEHSRLNIELVKFILDLDKTQVDGFSNRILTMAGDVGFQPSLDQSEALVSNCFAKFNKA
uniref:Dynein axonemal assembly factor 3 n=1 Tax=Ciona intestinalis TaxID=7719 RepID=F6ZAR8_CIOIN|nr:dynein assembly factor 3, axonemal [Ciona intestinalis]|eukprot:XP_002130641.1 dynein assembly factor 3, axonemal [Ciona intestinalis]